MPDLTTAHPDLGSILDNGPWTNRQKAISALTASALIFDGLDIQIVGFAIPAISQSWHIAKSMFASVLAAGLFGVALGSVLGGLEGDHIGRRPALILNVFLFAAATLGMAGAHSLTHLFLLRFVAGLGIGGALPNGATLTAEYTPLNHRPLATTLTIVCVPLGGVVAGIFATSLLTAHSWRVLFLVAGLLPLLHGCLLLFLLPESPRFLAQNPANAVRLANVLASIQRPVDVSQFFLAERPPRASPRELFRGTLARDTFALWASFFFCLLSVYLAFNWLPSILLNAHFTGKEASQALTLYNFGGIFGAVGVGWSIGRLGSRFPMSLSALVAILSAIVTTWLFHGTGSSHAALVTLICVQGIAVNAVQTTLYALATHIYTTTIRSTGVAFALAVGRGGAIISSYLGASLLSFHTSSYFILLACTMGSVLVAMQCIRSHIIVAD
ncbi:MAG TPA: MFS transporter [Acidobacteriaceae bacterium]|jgi:AAHS family 4-hydroxybenzoate transporter-like MFS transporter